MKLADPFAYLSFRSSADHLRMARGGVAVAFEPCLSPGHPRTEPGAFTDRFASLVSFEPTRAARFGVRYFCALAVEPREANDTELAVRVLNALPGFLCKDVVVAVGETGYHVMSEAEDAALEWQLHLAKRFALPALVRLPPAQRSRALRRALVLVRRCGLPEERVAIGPCDQETAAEALSAGCWAACSLGEPGADASSVAFLLRRTGGGRLLIGSGAGWDVSDPLGVPRLAARLGEAGAGAHMLESLLWRNPLRFFAQSGRLPSDLAAEAAAPEPEPVAP